MLRAKLISFLLLTLPIVLAVNYAYDETLWTKQLWSKWKLDNPLTGLNPTDENPKVVEAYPDIKELALNSVDGPGPRRHPQQGG